MRYDFTSHMERHGKDSIAVDGLGTGFAPEPPEEGFDVIPMWVADMNFPTVPTVTDAIIERAKHPAFGYFSPTDEYYDSIIRWQETRNGVTGLAPEHIGYENGVLGGVVATLNSFAAPGDKVLLHSPTYIGFTKSLENNGLSIVHSPLKIDEDGVWRMDFEDMEAKLAQNDIHAAVFCSPHNPCGRVWERWEIEPWSCTASTTAWWYPTRSGATSSCRATGTCPRRASPTMLAAARWPSTRRARPSTWPAWLAPTTSYTTRACETASLLAAQSATTTA